MPSIEKDPFMKHHPLAEVKVADKLKESYKFSSYRGISSPALVMGAKMMTGGTARGLREIGV
jgi:hypothetical protein